MVSAEPGRDRHRARRRRAEGRRRAAHRRARARSRASRAGSSPRRCSPGSRTRCGSCGRRSSARWCRSSSSPTRRRRSSAPTTRTSASAPRSGPRDRAKGERMARRIESGMVWINDHSYTHAALQCSWGGVKESGLGRSHSKFGFYECVERQARRLGARPHPRLLVAALRRDAGQGAARLRPPALRANGPRVKALREGAVALAKVGARTFRKGR